MESNEADMIAEARRIAPNVMAVAERLEAENLSLRSELQAAREEIEKLEKLKVHCPDCGADYAATGIEAGCPCRIQEALTNQIHATNTLAQQLQAAQLTLKVVEEERDQILRDHGSSGVGS